jgi:putative endonuclease
MTSSATPSSVPRQASARDLGAAAERRARRHLLLRGWRMCAVNWIGGGGEIDIVASRWRTLLIVEVRRRAGADAALASIDRAKLDRTIAAAAALVRTHRLQRYRLRFDVIGFDAKGRLSRQRDILRRGRPGI